MVVLGISFGVPEQDGHDGHHAQGHGIIQIGDDAGRIDLRQSCSHQNLCAIGQQSLDATGKRIENACAFATVQSETVADFLRDVSHGEDGDGVVGRTDIDEADQRGDRQLGSPFALHPGGKAIDDEVDASVGTDDLKKTSSHHGDDHQLAHSLDAFPHGRQPSEYVETAAEGAYDSSQ